MVSETEHENVPINGHLGSLHNPNWFRIPAESSIWVRLYTSLGHTKESFLEAAEKFGDAARGRGGFLSADEPVIVAFGHLNESKPLVRHTRILHAQPATGDTIVFFKVEDLELPDANYVFLTTPFRVDGTAGSEAAIRGRLDQAAGLLTLHAGLNFLRQSAFEAVVEVETGRYTVHDSPFRLPRSVEGPFLHPEIAIAMAEVAERLSTSTDPVRSRVRLALAMVARAARSSEGFLDYWTALELLCGGSAGRLKSTMSRLYGVKSHRQLEEESGIGVLASWRHGLVHNGAMPSMSADVERYVQVLCLDLMRHAIGLEPRYYLAAVLRSDRYDLSPLKLGISEEGSA